MGGVAASTRFTWGVPEGVPISSSRGGASSALRRGGGRSVSAPHGGASAVLGAFLPVFYRGIHVASRKPANTHHAWARAGLGGVDISPLLAGGALAPVPSPSRIS